jgi:hypothetical protein
VSPSDPCNTLICDADALIQLFLSSQGELLKKLKRFYGIRPVITEAVEQELFRARMRNSDKFQPQVQKALANGALTLLDEHNLGAFTSNDPHTTYISIQVEGAKNHVHLGKGEAYSHAAGVVLRAPVMSNDMKAIVIADRVRLTTAKPTIRAYDLFVLFHQIGELSDKDCDDIRKDLTGFGESPPAALAGCKFAEGLKHFCARLVDVDGPILANGAEIELADRYRLTVQRIIQAEASKEVKGSQSTTTLRDFWPKQPSGE